MGFLDDAPSSVKGMIVVFKDLGQYKYDVGDVFRDFIDYATACFLIDGDAVLAENLKNKYKEEYQQLNRIMVAWVKIMSDRITDDVHWFDALGIVYEYLASRSKKSWLGQFFTPESLCDLMTAINSPAQKGTVNQRINDCACGSGRTLLSFNALHPGNFMFGEDIDPICAKMTALNMAIHGCQGQATCMDTLSQKFGFAYQVNPRHQRPGFPPIPHLVPITADQCLAVLKLKSVPDVQILPDRPPIPEFLIRKPVESSPEKPKRKQTVMPGQLSIF